MKNLYCVFILLCVCALPSILHGQTLDVFNIEASQFPTVRAKFFAIDANGQQLTDIRPSDFQYVENGILKNILKVSCPALKPIEKVSITMSLDISSSMTSAKGADEIPITMGKITARNIAKTFSLPPNEMALQTCHGLAAINLDFTSNRQRILDAIDDVKTEINNNFTEHLLNPETGLLNVAKKGRFNRVAILYTDAWWHALTPEELQRCKDTCAKYNIRFYTAIYSRPEAEPNGIKKSLAELAEATGGRLYDGIITKEDADKLAYELKTVIQIDPCEIEWESDDVCDRGKSGVLTLLPNNVHDSLRYTVPLHFLSGLSLAPRAIRMRDVNPGSYKDTSVILTASGSSVTITKITTNHKDFSVIDYGGSPPPFILNANESRTLRIRFTPTDSLRVFSGIVFESNACSVSDIYLSGGFASKNLATHNVHLTHPNGSEVFLAGSDTIITWEGISPEDIVSLDYSLDKGVTWIQITDKATNLRHPWHIPNAVSNECLVRIRSQYTVEAPGQWSKTGIVEVDNRSTYSNARGIAKDKEGNLYVCGTFESATIDFGEGFILTNKDGHGIFIVKYNAEGNIIWAKTTPGGLPLGNPIPTGEISERVRIAMTCDELGNVILCGKFGSREIDFGNGVVLPPKTESNIFIAKYNQDGTILWAKALESYWYNEDKIYSVATDALGNIVVGGYAHEKIAFGSNTPINNSAYVAKFDPSGIIVWAKAVKAGVTSVTTDADDNVYIGGGFDEATVDFGSGIVLYKYTELDDVANGYVAKFDLTGSIQWAKSIGGYYNNRIQSIISDKAGSIYASGTFNAEEIIFENGIKLKRSDPLDGTYDAFVTRYSEGGDILWAKKIGGTGEDNIISIDCDENGSLYICGNSDSRIIMFGSEHTLTAPIEQRTLGVNGFLANFNQQGHVRWSQLAYCEDTGSWQNVEPLSIIGMDGNAYMCGRFIANILNPGNGIPVQASDDVSLFVAKYAGVTDATQIDMSDELFSIVRPLATSHNIDMGRVLVTSSKDTLIQSFISNTGSFPIRIDAINVTGTNASDFQLVSGIPPYTIAIGENKAVEFRFRPSFVGSHSADLDVITQTDILHQSIMGEGVQPLIQASAAIIDFGIKETGTTNDTTVSAVVKNIGGAPLTITGTSMLGPDKEQFSIVSGGGSFMLGVGEQRTMQLRFSPKYIGRTSGQIGFDYVGMLDGQPAIVQLFGQGIGGSVSIMDDSAYVGQTRSIKLMLGKVKPQSIAQTTATKFMAKLAYSRSILTPAKEVLTNAATVHHGAEYDTLTITQQWNAGSVELGRIPFIATLGDRTITDIELLQFTWLNDAGTPIEYDTELQGGIFTVLGICLEGGERLYDISGTAQMVMMTPNPVRTDAEVQFTTIEKGLTRITLTDILGRQIELAYKEYPIGENILPLSLEKLTQGIYTLTMQTATQVFTQQVIIEK